VKFPTTAWSLVVSAGSSQTQQSRAALEQLCSAYWRPVYAYVCKIRGDTEAARDLTQEFFKRLIEKRYVAAADPAEGPFRGFLLTAVRRFLYNALDQDHALKRGGGAPLVALDEESETRHWPEPSHSVTPAAIYDRQWALTVLSLALSRLQAQEGRDRFEQLKPFLTGDADRGAYEKAAADLGTTANSLKTAVHRLRKQYRDALRSEILATVGDASEVDGEIRHLMDVLRNSPEGESFSAG
jgi:DNA-directed RNA polymerase specialized sigma24 family protein